MQSQTKLRKCEEWIDVWIQALSWDGSCTVENWAVTRERGRNPEVGAQLKKTEVTRDWRCGWNDPGPIPSSQRGTVKPETVCQGCEVQQFPLKKEIFFSILFDHLNNPILVTM